jgi:hypothetical protein
MRAVYPKTLLAGGLVGLLAACASLPDGPSMPALPGSQKSLDQFALDDGDCRSFAVARLGGITPQTAANQSAVGSAVAGAAVGAAAGGLIDGSSGAGVGAGVGLLYGALVGTSTAQGSYAATQQQFDGLYYACMYARGQKVPVPAYDVGRYRALYESALPPAARSAPPAGATQPPPGYRPPGMPPP